jgi:hypothetical protein
MHLLLNELQDVRGNLPRKLMFSNIFGAKYLPDRKLEFQKLSVHPRSIPCC